MFKFGICTLFAILSTNIALGQINKEVIYLLFDKSNKEYCNIETEFSSDHDGKLDGKKRIQKYRKKSNDGKSIFEICDEKFIFNSKKFKPSEVSVKYLDSITIRSIEYLKKVYNNQNEFKHDLFERIVILEKLDNHTLLKHDNVYWCCEWSSED